MMSEQQNETPEVLPYAASRARPFRKQARWAVALGVVSGIGEYLSAAIAAVGPYALGYLGLFFAAIALFLTICMGIGAVGLGVWVLRKDRTEWLPAAIAIVCGFAGARNITILVTMASQLFSEWH